MDKWWSWFWKFFGGAFGIAFAGAIVFGLVNHSPESIYTNVQKIIALGLGVCGVIGLAVVPLELYFGDLKQGRMKNNAPAAGEARQQVDSGDEHALS